MSGSPLTLYGVQEVTPEDPITWGSDPMSLCEEKPLRINGWTIIGQKKATIVDSRWYENYFACSVEIVTFQISVYYVPTYMEPSIGYRIEFSMSIYDFATYPNVLVYCKSKVNCTKKTKKRVFWGAVCMNGNGNILNIASSLSHPYEKKLRGVMMRERDCDL